MAGHILSGEQNGVGGKAVDSTAESPRRFRLAVYGGAFDPLHSGHVSVIRRMLECADNLMIVPSYCHADGKRMADFDLRCSWIHKLIARLGCERVICSTLERQLGQGGAVIYSYDLLCTLSAQWGVARSETALVIGEDNRQRVGSFYRGRELLQEFGLLVADEQLSVHSSAIRALVRQGRAVPPEWCPPEVSQDLMVYGSAY
ncbi:adenylyltransferase/cytidyltransferase family protein [Pseudomonas sp. Pseusp88]|uniref:adenylyltransferase/cytidyltransferase family protein n=1 Tax=Pseudomonas sp. Pseusp88 TaxID=3243061 RepID=UPI0039A55E40